jgi:integrase/recombinase XerC
MDTNSYPIARSGGGELAKRKIVSMQDVVHAFLQRQNENTRRAYEKELRRFSAWLEVDDFDEAARILFGNGAGKANQIVYTFQQFLLGEKGFSPSTVNRAMAAIKSMAKVARMLGMIDWTIEIPGVSRRSYRDTSGPGMEAYKKIVKVLEENGATERGARDRAMIYLLFERALRRFEVVGLDMEDVDFRKSRVKILGKGRYESEWVTISRQTMQAIMTWLAFRGQGEGPLFASLDPAGKGDGRLTKESLSRIVKRIGKQAGVDAWPHGLRHTAITAVLDATNGDVRKAMKFSRHKKVETLLIYDDNRQDVGGELTQLLADQLEDAEGED